MAYSFDGSTSRLTLSGSPATLTWDSGSLWFYPTDSTRDQSLFLHVNTTGSVWYGVKYMGASSGGKCRFQKAGDVSYAESAAAANTNAWNHLYWSMNSYVSPSKYQISLNGETLVSVAWGAPAGSATTATSVGYKRTGLATGTEWFAGYMAELSLYYDVMDVSYGDVYKALSQRFQPLRITTFPGVGVGLINYWTMRKGLLDVIEGRTLGSTSAPTLVAEHPPIRPISSGVILK
ncbi:LamG-like jellyroll fold domain-containing protein [Nitrospira sp. BLG_1]|uniref:LamG-like jellyroll fold domain-containing protein n=1 Tax=Nitrospira sp. BLG_1 TaxID=3395883 RepID=UPI0039BCCBB3